MRYCNRLPSIRDFFHQPRIITPYIGHCERYKPRKVAVCPETRVGHGAEPDLAHALPRGADRGGGSYVNSVICDATVNMHAAIVVINVSLKVVIVGGLGRLRRFGMGK